MNGLRPPIQDELSLHRMPDVDYAYQLALKAEDKLRRHNTRRTISEKGQTSTGIDKSRDL